MKAHNELTVEGEGRKLGLSRGQSYRAVRAGIIPVVRVGRAMYPVPGAIDSLIEAAKQQAIESVGALLANQDGGDNE
jgi:hypothetical protein